MVDMFHFSTLGRNERFFNEKGSFFSSSPDLGSLLLGFSLLLGMQHGLSMFLVQDENAVQAFPVVSLDVL